MGTKLETDGSRSRYLLVKIIEEDIGTIKYIYVHLWTYTNKTWKKCVYHHTDGIHDTKDLDLYSGIVIYYLK